ncbi:DNA-directed RNA polymerase III subunit RPC25 KNAG_0H02220 [Huiozyma naganishii CBS 8797]|uniref:DNA-directed RNA polymerase subunit n=1 Tax=Huiozyma naganishii (strain ATCC MYA-139 / BCRC 22969 / CBS 8797 / KCTC 17520 / NBRC 10181 / NCYC 3082 / Yp74L-3) TaxID=1071383 RepID=J7S9Q1_HUIN7|nr:hypothetical protein KNAG_0H02220 [Kazachstania naganishii CBS 8797]CCK71636.1 hypothetical protein KNAG_0H02220 [Kazachstania naganishii CBS 8797]
MFILSKIKELVRVPPDQFQRKTAFAVTHQLNTKYANKVIPNLGLCISVYDLLEVDEGQLKPGDGATYTNVTFRALIFKPFVGEILTGWITNCNANGMQVTLKGQMFQDIFIPANMLFDNCYFLPNESAWVWAMDDDNKLYFDINEMIRFRVEQEVFIDVKPSARDEAAKNEEDNDETGEKKKPAAPPYAILGSCQTDGMGLVSWWE